MIIEMLTQIMSLMMMPKKKFNDDISRRIMPKKKIAIITGAASGIGLALARNFSAEGYSLALIDQNSIPKLEQELDIDYYKLDITDFNRTEKTIKEILHNKGTIDVLINNAGIMFNGFLDMPLEQVQQLIQTNALGHFNITKQIAKQMKQQKHGYIFNIASRNGLDAKPDLGSYAMSKFALVALNEALYEEMIKFNVKVTALCPSVVDTNMAKDSPVPQQERIPTQDIVNTINYLLKLSNNTLIREMYIDCHHSLAKRLNS